MERILRWIKHEALHSLVHANAGIPHHSYQQTTSPCGDGYGPAFLARCLDRSSAHEKFLIQSLLFSEFLIFIRLQIRPVFKKIGKGGVSLLEEIRISGTDV